MYKNIKINVLRISGRGNRICSDYAGACETTGETGVSDSFCFTEKEQQFQCGETSVPVE